MKVIRYKNLFQIILLIRITLLLKLQKDELINLTDYKYPKQDKSNDVIKLAILGTNDLHGEIFPDKFIDSNSKRYSNGGGIYLYSYAKILREEWQDYFLWLDGGDQFQGTLECMLSNCSIMKDFYNIVELDGISIGNHEFDYGQELLREHIKSQNYITLCANIFDKTKNKYIWEDGMWENVEPYHIYTLGTYPKIKIGVIGLATNETISFTNANISNLEFKDYFNETKKFVKILREEKKVDSIILLTHFGPKCSQDTIEKTNLKMRNKSTIQKECEENHEIMPFLKKIKDEGIKIDAVIGAHVHDIVHHWIYDIPVIESSGSNYFNILYLPFKINKDGTVTLQNTDIEIEGPVPVCEKLWPKNKKCNFQNNDSSLMKNFTFHNKNIILDEELMKKMKFWNDIIDEKTNNILVESTTEMSLNYQSETVLTNFVTDIGKIITDSDICFYNLGGIRSKWHIGGINEIDIFKMFPFNNTWVRFEMNGEEITRMFKELNVLQIYPASGVLQTFLYNNNIYDLVDITFWNGKNEEKIIPNHIYKVCTNDFTAGGGEDMGKVRQWYKTLRNETHFGIIRESFVEFVKKMKVIKKDFFIDSYHVPRITIIESNNSNSLQ